MALVKCFECERIVSDKAEFCLGCGFPLQKYRRVNHDKKKILKVIRAKNESNDFKIKRLKNLDEVYLDDKAFVFEVLNIKNNLLDFARTSEDIDDIVLGIDNISLNLFNDKDIVMLIFNIWKKAVSIDGLLESNVDAMVNCVDNISERLCNDKDVIMSLVSIDGTFIDIASDDLKNDREVVIAAVKTDKEAIDCVNESFRNDIEIRLLLDNLDIV